jgi:predicted PurR-regulated permease PerM
MFRTKIARVLVAVALAVVLYAVAGFVIAPKIVRSALLEEREEGR